MGEIAKIMMCHDCKKRLFIHQIDEEGISSNGVMYMVKKYSDKNYLLDKEYTPSEKITSLSLLSFAMEYIPKVGKFELEAFLAEKLLHALYVTKDLTSFFNMEVYFNNDGKEYYLTSEDIKRYFLPLFVPSTLGNTVFLTFKEQKLQ